jgi:hypothetical protein
MPLDLPPAGLAKPHSPGNPLYNKYHPIADGLVFGAIPGGMHRQDIVSGNQPRNIGTGANGTLHGSRRTALGSGYESKSNGNGVISWPITPEILSIDNTNEFTFAVWYETDTSGQWATLLNIPYRDTAWANPFMALGIRRSSSTAFMDLSKATSASSRTSITAGRFTATNGPLTMAVVTGHGGDVYFYINSDRGGLQTWSTTVIDMSQAVEVVMCNRQSTSLGEGFDGIVNAGYIWNRALEHSEIQALYADPYIFIRPEDKAFQGVSVASSVEQEGFRFRQDDGSESAATWRQAQDVDDTISKEANFRLRFLLNATNDPATDAYKIQYKKTSEGDSSYKDILPT